MRWSWLKRRRWEQQMDSESQVHLENHIAGMMERGLTRDQAEERTRRDFGSLELAKTNAVTKERWNP